MNKTFIFSGLLGTAVLLPSVTPHWTVSATQQAENTTKEETSTHHDDNSKSDDKVAYRSEETDTSKKKATIDDKDATPESQILTHLFSQNKNSSFNTPFSTQKNGLDPLFHSVLNDVTDVLNPAYFFSKQETSNPNTQTTVAPENRDFLEQLQTLLTGQGSEQHEPQPAPQSKKTAASESSSQTEALASKPSDAHADATKNEASHATHTQKPNSDAIDSESSTSSKNTDSTASHRNDSAPEQNEAVIDSLLDQYSEKARQTNDAYRKQKAAISQHHTNTHESQITNPDSFKQTREQAPSQSFTSSSQDANTRQTSLFEVIPKSDSDFSETQQMRAIPQNSTRAFIRDIAKAAHDIGQQEDIYASVMIAQAILESDSGKSELARAPYYNLFGIKGGYQGQSVNFQTLESDGNQLYQIQADFRTYPNQKASLSDYADLIKNGIDGNPTIYKEVWKSESSDYRSATTALVGTYATDPQYDKKLQAIIEAYDLTRFDEKDMPTSLDDNPMPSPSQDDIGTFKPFSVSGPSPYPHGQCTWYVYHRMAQFGINIPGDMGNASDWTYSALIKGYSVSRQPKVHHAVVFKPNQLGADRYYGHVAFVEKVLHDGSIVVSESNVKGLGVISYRTINANQAQKLDYISGDLSTLN
ncbi:glucosaminidase domain-containing protein [Staphylococcus lutrae]|uniref:Peptidase C51 domain-containing protein n=1 Tax=Staphylococcus lutrae TaxID=155085 RepID=A0AAC9RTP3_9STAP|nr:glucosaminidase domain-containing protein [Staphylococcus lutrae]ARJ50652.1 hypothetical protein B5P37_04630 [Staphylococcus lutrae]PNZ39128.1 CHAP domain-containing protein [Staphylococcus lutrae]